jgi:hypothetical protein
MKVVSSQWLVVSKSGVGFVLCAMLLTLCFSAEAQQPKKVARIGLLSGGANPAKPVLWEPFFEALREFGYVEGQNVILERRFAMASPSAFLSSRPNSSVSRLISSSQLEPPRLGRPSGQRA